MALALLVVAALGLALGLWLGRGAGPAPHPSLHPATDQGPAFRLQPLRADDLGVERDSPFLLTASGPVSLRQVREALRVSPPLEMDVRQDGEGRFLLRPRSPLAPDAIYRFTLSWDDGAGRQPLSWAFQVKGAFRVLGTLPRDRATAVPISTGIEITFSHEGFADPTPYFSIDPPTPGRFEQHGRTLVFVPRELKPSTLYTVRLAKGFPLAGGEAALAEDYVFQFETAVEQVLRPPFFFLQETYETPPNEAPAMAVYAVANEPLAVQVFRFAGREQFLQSLAARDRLPPWAYGARRHYLQDTSGLTLVASFEAPLESQRQIPAIEAYFRFPEPLPAGYYLVEARQGDQARQTWLQVTPVSAYVTGTRTRTLLWANDAVTGRPIAGARVEMVGGGLLAETDADGIAVFDTPPELAEGETVRRYLVLLAPDGNELVLPGASTYSLYGFCLECDLWPGFARRLGDLYWRYVYTDRLLYQPTDSLRFWGIVRHRETGQPPDSLTVELVREVCRQAPPFSCDEVVSSRTTVRPSPWGTFQGELSFRALTPAIYSLRVKDGETVVYEVGGVQVTNYVKPAYRLEVEPEWQAAFVGDQVQARVVAQFWEGTPLPGLEVRYGLGLPFVDTVTDENGQASLSFRAPDRSDGISFPYAYPLVATPARAEEGDISGQGVVLVFPARVHLEAQAEYADGRVTVRVATHHVDISRLATAEGGPALGYLDPSRYLGPPATGQRVTGTLVRARWERQRTGETYDFISKQVVPTYSYRQVWEEMGSIELTTDQDGRAVYSFPAEPGSFYEVRLATTDAQGRTWRTVTSAYTATYSPYAATGFYYLEDLRRAARGEPADFFSDSFYIYERAGARSLVTYRPGDEVALAFKRDGELMPEGQGRYLFVQTRLGLLEHRLQASPVYRFPFQRQHIPNVNVQGVYFNGRTYVVTGQRTVRYDQEEARLQVSVSPDRAFYRPGDEVTLTVEVRDGQGQPVQAEVNLSLVDEALFRLQESGHYWPISADPLPSLYRAVGPGVLFVHASHRLPRSFLLPGGAGGGGESSPREDFRDRAFFGQVRTDASGRGQVTFRLPDNVTSWRITYQAVSQDLRAGSGSRSLTVTLPLFVDAILNRVYLQGDRPLLRLRAFGRALAPGDQVSFSVDAPSLGIQGQTLRGRAFQPVELPLPPLPLGTHRLTITVEGAGLRDTIVRTFQVLPGHLLRADVRTLPLQAGTVIVGEGTGPTTVLVVDRGRGAFYPLVQRLRWTWGERADQALARWLGATLLQEHFGEEEPAPEFRPAGYQAPDGGIALLPYSSSDLALSAKAAALGAPFDREALRLYFRRVLDAPNEGRERQTMALLGLAALGEPVLARAQALLRRPDLTPFESLYLALAVYVLGDHQSARDTLERLVSLYGEDRDPYLRLRLSDDGDEVLEATALAAALASGLGAPQRDALVNYIFDTRGKDVLVEMEKALSLAWALPGAATASARVALEVEGDRQEATLERGRALRLELQPGQSLRVLAAEGQVAALVSRLVAASASELSRDTELRVRRTYYVGGRATTQFRDGELVQVVLQFELPPLPLPGCYQVTDYLPAGLRPLVRLPFADGWPRLLPNWYPLQAEGQEVSFCVAPPRGEPIVYYARVVNGGEFRAEPPLIRALASEASANVGEGTTVSIR